MSIDIFALSSSGRGEFGRRNVAVVGVNATPVVLLVLQARIVGLVMVVSIVRMHICGR